MIYASTCLQASSWISRSYLFTYPKNTLSSWASHNYSVSWMRWLRKTNDCGCDELSKQVIHRAFGSHMFLISWDKLRQDHAPWRSCSWIYLNTELNSLAFLKPTIDTSTSFYHYTPCCHELLANLMNLGDCQRSLSSILLPKTSNQWFYGLLVNDIHLLKGLNNFHKN